MSEKFGLESRAGQGDIFSKQMEDGSIETAIKIKNNVPVSGLILRRHKIYLRPQTSDIK